MLDRTSFLRDDKGSFNVLFAVTLVPLLLGAGTAVDYSRAASHRMKVQSAVDATALALSKQAAKLTDAQLQSLGEQLFEGVYAYPWSDAGSWRRSGEFTRKTLTVTRTSKRVSVTVDGFVGTTLMNVAGISTMGVAARGEAAWGTRRVEVALVLDNTGSMGGTKIIELRKASANLVDVLAKVAYDADAVKIGLVPFATQVRFSTTLKDEPWLDHTVNGVNKATWNGCVQDRDQPYDTNDDAQRATVGDTLAKPHPSVNCASTTLAPVMPLTTDWAALKTSIAAMTAGGNTNTTIGLAWGHAMLSPGAPLGGAAAFGTDGVEKFMIMLTDGDNTQNRWTMSQAAIDARTKLACDAIKAKGVRLYTIRVINGNAALLKDCASGPQNYKDVKNASELDAVFQSIASEIAAIRLTM